MTLNYRGTNGDNRYSMESVFPYSETVRMVGLGGHDLLSGAFLHDNFLYGGTGNDTLTGGSFHDQAWGHSGNDYINSWMSDTARFYGGGGQDTLVGGASSLLDGGRGADSMIGGEGGDIYVVDNVRDVIVEEYTPFFDNNPNPRDTVRASIDWTLGARLENLELTGTAALSGTGNMDHNQLTGNAGGNVLRGLAGNDVLSGLAGNDTLEGGYGRDVLIGGAGADLLRGGMGADRFVFNSVEDSRAGKMRDTIADFAKGDKIVLQKIDADLATAGNQAFDFIGNEAFSGLAGELRYVGGVIQADVNGDGRVDLAIRVNGQPDLSATDFLL